MSSIITILKELFEAKRPVTLAGVVTLILAVIPGVNITPAEVGTIVTVVGAVAAFVEKYVVKKSLLP